MVNVASAGGNIDYWGEYAQTDHEQYTVSQDEWGFVVVEVEAGPDPQLRLRRVSRGNEYVPRDNEVRDEVIVRLHADPPTTPVALWPQDEAVSPDCATLWACPFHDPDDELHGASWWQVSADCSDFSAPAFDAWVQHENQYNGEDTQAGDDLTDVKIGDLAAQSTWCWRVRHRDRGLRWSEWSEPVTFTTGATTLLEIDLVNPGAEDGTDGWTVTAGYLESLTAGECDGTEPHDGDRYFGVGGLCESAEYGEAFQRADVSEHADAIDAGTTLALFEGWLSDWGGDDRPEIELVFRDGDEAEIGRSERIGSTATTWELVQGDASVPVGTRAIDFVLAGTRNAGVDNDSYVDDLRLRLAVDDSAGCDEPPPDLDPEQVCPEPPATDDDDDTAADDDDDDDTAASGDDDGCGACSQASGGAGLAAWLLLLFVTAMRSRHT